MPSTTHAARVRAAEAALADADPVLGGLIRRHGPCALRRRRRDPFNTLATSIISQQLSTKAADAIYARVAARVGDGKVLRQGQFAAVAPITLRACGLSWSKAKWLRELDRRVTEGEFSFRGLARLDDDAAIERLDALPGVGRWTAEMFLIFALGRLDIFAMDDVGLRRIVDRLYGKGRRLSNRRTLTLTRRWAPWRSVASWYLWRETDPESQAIA